MEGKTALKVVYGAEHGFRLRPHARCAIPEMYKRGKNYKILVEGEELVYHGTWSRFSCSKPVDASFLAFAEGSVADEVASRLEKAKHTSVLQLLSTIEEKGCYILVVESIKDTYSLNEWLNLNLKNFWDVSCDKKTVYGLGEDSLRFFKGLFEGLEVINDKKNYHGNVLGGGLRVKKDNSVVLFDFSKYKEDEYENGNGLLKDLWDLRWLVEKAVENHSKNLMGLDEPPVIKLFLELYDDLSRGPTKLSVVRDPASFILNAPLVFDDERRYKYVRKICELWHLDEDYFVHILKDEILVVTPLATGKDVDTTASVVCKDDVSATIIDEKGKTKEKGQQKGKEKLKSLPPPQSPSSEASSSKKGKGKRKGKQKGQNVLACPPPPPSPSFPTRETSYSTVSKPIKIPELSNWQHECAETKELRELITYHSKHVGGYYIHTAGILFMHRHAYEHLSLKNLVVARMLYKACSTALPRLYNLLRHLLQEFCYKYRRLSLVEFLKTGPDNFM